MKRLRSAVATKSVIDQLSPDVREQRARHAIVREWGERLAGARADVRATQDVLERTKRLLPEAEQAVAEAMARLADIEAEAPFADALMAG